MANKSLDRTKAFSLHRIFYSSSKPRGCVFAFLNIQINIAIGNSVPLTGIQRTR